LLLGRRGMSRGGDEHVARGRCRPGSVAHQAGRLAFMIILGVILLIVGFLTGISLLWTIGIVLVVVGLVLALVGRTGRAVGGRAHWY
jgi:VIT1/CCC1 family predicted Fe2+/Mn2+ transporter